ncbi:hypothetical protein IU470_28810 [Nocardia abscessus]|uniref:Uncharacterized protein n=1 Tax=Nocardia abscessus TaxID=120957 RepID=A0ABS0CFH5_9NOCA|nr:hypothetical protein [Nocardia abscessus]MBF6229081.1 hypothetical protein [Nocardia abscessus]
MGITGIESARHKLGRARHHIEALGKELEAFVKSDPLQYEPRWDYDEEADTFACTLHVTKSTEIPDEFALIAGDVLTNLRAALDHSIFTHVLNNWPQAKGRALSKREIKSIQFPIVDEELKPEHGARFAPHVRRVIERIQPYNGGEALELRTLRELVNADKHHSLLVTNGAEFHIQVQHDLRYEHHSNETYEGTVLDVGARFARIVFRRRRDVRQHPSEFVKFDIGFPIQIAIPPNDALQPIDICLKRLWNIVHITINNLEQAGV